MREINEIIIHCSDTRPNWMDGQPLSDKIDEIRRWHVQDNGWTDIGYHFVIDRDGTIAKGRPIERVGAHVKDHNSNSIGICLLGGFGSAATDAFADNFTSVQNIALRDQIAFLESQFGPLKVSGHNDYAAKACPGFRVARWLAGKAPARTSPAQSVTLQASWITKMMAGMTPLVAGLANIPWQSLAVISVLSVVILVAAGVIDLERLKKWKAGDR